MFDDFFAENEDNDEGGDVPQHYILTASCYSAPYTAPRSHPDDYDLAEDDSDESDYSEYSDLTSAYMDDVDHDERNESVGSDDCDKRDDEKRISAPALSGEQLAQYVLITANLKTRSI